MAVPPLGGGAAHCNLFAASDRLAFEFKHVLAGQRVKPRHGPNLPPPSTLGQSDGLMHTCVGRRVVSGKRILCPNFGGAAGKERKCVLLYASA